MFARHLTILLLQISSEPIVYLQISKTGQVTVRLNGNRTLTIQVVVQEEQAECSTCRKLKH